jgi:hypothetical protein
MLAVPFGAELRVDVEAGEARTMVLPDDVMPVAKVWAEWDPAALTAGRRVLPSLSRAVAADPAVYASASPYPGSLAEVVSDGVMRGQRLVGIAAYPVQYVPATRELMVYESLEVQVSFEGVPASGVGGQSSRLESLPFEALVRSDVLNHDSALNWRRGSMDTSLPQALPWMPPSPGYRVKVEKEGIYTLTYRALRDAGLPVDSLNPGTFRLYNMGEEVAIHVEGDGDASFEDGEYLLFYGEQLNSKYTAYNVYWLTYGGAAGKTMPSRSGAALTGTTPSSHRNRLRLEENIYYIAFLTGDEDLERFVWDYAYPPEKPTSTNTFSLPALASGSANGRLELAMFGYVDDPIDPDHHTRIYLNGTLVEDAKWDGITWRLADVEFPQSLLKAGENTITVECPNDTGVGKDLVYVDWATLEFAKAFVAAGNVLAFHYEQAGTWKYEVGGFTTDEIAVFDVTDPKAVERIAGASVTPSGSAYSLAFSDEVSSATDYWLGGTSALLEPVGIELDQPSNLGSTANGADYIIVSHEAFAAAVAPLRAYRASRLSGFATPRAIQVDLQDVYDEFGYGIVGAQPIRDFLAYAYDRWQAPAPTYALLVGDGHYDPKDYGGVGLSSYLPPYLAPVDPQLVETAADNRFVSFTPGDNFPEMIVGRLAVNSAAEATVVVNKALDYEQKPAGGWNNSVLFVADSKDRDANYPQLSDDLIDCCLPSPYAANRVHLGVTHANASAARGAIKAGINAGQLIVNYAGDAGSVAWGKQGFFSITDIPSLTNGSRLPVMLPMAPLDGHFHYPFIEWGDGMAESVVRAEGRGAVASWSATGFATGRGHEHLDRGFFDALFKQDKRVLGEAAMAGKLRLAATGSNLDLLDTFMIFGDPALLIHSPWEGEEAIYLPMVRRSAR